MVSGAHKGGSSLLNPKDPWERGELVSRDSCYQVESPGAACYLMVA